MLYTELAIFDKLAGEGQVYKTNDELKAGLIKAYKEFWQNTKEAGGDYPVWWPAFGNFDESNPASFLLMAMLRWLDLADEFIAINNEVADYGHQLGLKVWTHNCRGNYESRSASGGTYEAIAENSCVINYDRFFLEWDSDVSGDLKALASLKDKRCRSCSWTSF